MDKTAAKGEDMESSWPKGLESKTAYQPSEMASADRRGEGAVEVDESSSGFEGTQDTNVDPGPSRNRGSQRGNCTLPDQPAAGDKTAAVGRCRASKEV